MSSAPPPPAPNEPAPPPEAPRPFWKNPFVLAFAVGIVFLTAMPVLQRRFLKAPPPVRTLAQWKLGTEDGGVIGSDALAGRVWLAFGVPSRCDDAPCRERLEAFGRSVTHVDDLHGKVQMVAFVMPGARAEAAAVAGNPLWHRAVGTPEELAPVLMDLRLAWDAWAHTDAGTTPEEMAALPGVAVVDQNGAVRGFWRDDAAGRGNAVNAARLLAQYGAHP